MGLVDYSDSDASDSEQPTTSSKVSSRPAFQKVVDRSNPGKVRVSLPQTVNKETENRDEPPAKKPKLGGGGLGGFNSFLPAPKRTGPAANGSAGKSPSSSSIRPGISLRTGAEPGFSREAVSEDGNDIDGEELQSSGLGMNLPPPKSTPAEPTQKPADVVKLVGKPTMFKPLSVSRKPTKKKKPVDTAAVVFAETTANPPSSQSQENKTSQRPKISLFSISRNEEESASPITGGEYEPMIYGARVTEDGEEVEAQDDLSNFTPQDNFTAPQTTQPGVQSLDNIAADLNLSAAERRQLFGRQKGSQNHMPAVTKVINFNTDEEYRQNEALRAAGEPVKVAPFRSIAPGKHSLQQLVNAVQSQKEAFEESFAQGRNNRKEAGSKYGW